MQKRKTRRVRQRRPWGLGLSVWRRDALRTTLWVTPVILVVAALVLFGATLMLDHAAADGNVVLPRWINSGGPDAARQILTGIATAVITVVGLVFSITIVALTLASTQFGPRMLRNFIRDRGTQATLGTLVASFVYSVATLTVVTNEPGHATFVPHLSITVTLLLLLVDIAVLIYFIHHIAISIQVTNVVAQIANDLDKAVGAFLDNRNAAQRLGDNSQIVDLRQSPLRNTHGEVGTVRSATSGYLQSVSFDVLIRIATANGAVIQLTHRPGHFVAAGEPLALVSPSSALPSVSHDLARVHAIGPHRTLTQDVLFAIDQLTEIGLRALSAAINDVYTAITCIDWLSDGLAKISAHWVAEGRHYDATGKLRVIESTLPYARLVNGAFDKLRQAAVGVPAINIRQIEALTRILAYTTTDNQREVLARQATMIMRSIDGPTYDPNDRDDVRHRYELFTEALSQHVT